MSAAADRAAITALVMGYAERAGVPRQRAFRSATEIEGPMTDGR